MFIENPLLSPEMITLYRIIMTDYPRDVKEV